ncbi:MAG: XRE family transcriptional regulator [Oscillospiraceae bacterium]|nr:XRE family transcriptional regulator [Oscillospiraceae bacterium]
MFYDRLKIACKNAHTTVTATLKAIGVGTANGTYWKNGSAPSSDIVVKLAEFLGVSTDYLLLGKKDTKIEITPDAVELISAYNSVDMLGKAMIKERALTLAERAAEERAAEQRKKTVQSAAPAADEQPNPEDDEQEQSDHCVIPYYDYPASAGTGLFLDETIAEDLTVKATPEALTADFAIPIDGDSMEKDFTSGDIVLVKSCPNIPEGQIGIFVLDGDVYIKEYGGDCLISHNSEYKPIMLKDYGLSICLGHVLGKAKAIKKDRSRRK